MISTHTFSMNQFTKGSPLGLFASLEEILTPEVIASAQHFTHVQPFAVEIPKLSETDPKLADKLSATFRDAIRISSDGARDNLLVSIVWSKISDVVIVPPDTGLFQTLLEENGKTIEKSNLLNETYRNLQDQLALTQQEVTLHKGEVKGLQVLLNEAQANNKEILEATVPVTEFKATIAQKDDLIDGYVKECLQLQTQLEQLRLDFSTATLDFQKTTDTVNTQNEQIATIQGLLTAARVNLAEGSKDLAEAKLKRTILSRITDPVTVATAVTSSLVVYYFMKSES